MFKKIVVITLAVIVTLVVALSVAYFWYRDAVSNDASFYEEDISAFETADKASFPPAQGIVFVGSSSIRFWHTLAQDMSPLEVVQRGFGGAHMSHVLHNFDRIITPYQPKAVVVFVGGNDLGAGKSVQSLISNYQSFVDKLKQDLPNTDLWILSMKPSKLRWEIWPDMELVDDYFSDLENENENIYLVDTGRSLLNKNGEPDEVYAFDGLHLNAEGYRRWSALLQPKLLEKYGPTVKHL